MRGSPHSRLVAGEEMMLCRALPLAWRRCCVDRGLRRLKPRTFTAGVDQSGWDLARDACSAWVWLGWYAAASHLGRNPSR